MKTKNILIMKKKMKLENITKLMKEKRKKIYQKN